MAGIDYMAKFPEMNNDPLSALFKDQKQVKTTDDRLESIESILKDIANGSQSRARDRKDGDEGDWRNSGKTPNFKTKNVTKSFTDGLEEALKDAIGVSSFKRELNGIMGGFAKDLGVEIEQLPGMLGKELGNQALSALKNNTKFGKELSSKLESFQSQAINSFKTAASSKYKDITGFDIGKGDIVNKPASFVKDNVGDLAEDAAGGKIASSLLKNGPKAAAGVEVAAGAEAAAGAALAGGSATAAAEAVTAGLLAVPGLGEAVAAVIAISIAVDVLSDIFGKTFESLKKLGKSLTAAANRDFTEREKRTENANARLKADVESIVKYPFETLQKAAESIQAAWDANLRTINQTQGYTKANLQDLISNYAQRIKKEGLQSEVSSADLITNLSNVLRSGLSGKVAEQFAYTATKLNAAMPTHDFFAYASSYASLAANQIKQGKSQAEAIEYADRQLNLFASSISYASRELAGGFSSGLKDASSIFEKAVQIATASKTNNPSQIAGVLSSVSAITGSIAPDLASSMVDAVYQAAVGGNSPSLVALRSLAGGKAGNTDFLNQLMKDPKKVFTTLFNNLASMQNMSKSNYMEVAEGLSSVFGISKEAMSRVDFSYLAKAVQNMDVSNNALNQNLKQLASGQSTLTAEQMRIKQINQYMVDQGLSYVLDNAVARSIQEHMWNEQLANKIMENTFAVEIQGDLLTLATDALNALGRIINLIAPFGAMHLGYELGRTKVEMDRNKEEVKRILEAGKVGQGNAEALHNLTARGQDLKLTNSYLSQIVEANKSTKNNQYRWAVLGKSLASALGTTATGTSASSFLNEKATEKSINTSRIEYAFNKMKSTMSSFFGDTVQNKINNAIIEETKKAASKVAISESSIMSLAKEYVANPSKYGLNYDSKLANASKASSLSGFNAESQRRLLEVARNQAEADLRKEAEIKAKDKATSLVNLNASRGKYGQVGYEAWAATASKYGISDFKSSLREIGYNEDDVKNYFKNLENQQQAKRAQDRQDKEESFWKGTQDSLNTLNVNVHDVLDKGDLMGIMWPGIDSWLADIDSSGNTSGPGFRGDVTSRLDQINQNLTTYLHNEMYNGWMKEFKKGWEDYYIRHTTYNEHLGTGAGEAYTKALKAVKAKEKSSSTDAINALTQALTNNKIEDLMDPTVQQNVFLAQILRVVQGIFQQNNTQGKLALPDAIAALATGMTVTEVK